MSRILIRDPMIFIANSRQASIITAALTLAFSTAAIGAESSVDDLDQALRRAAVGGEFAGTLLVARSGEQILLKGYGLADRETETPFTPDTVSSLGSLTKQFTAAAILKLRDSKKLELTDRLDNFFEDLPTPIAAITLHQLLTHTAGLPDALRNDEDYISRDDYLALAFSRKLKFEPGTRHAYSNVGYSILAAVVEIKSGRSYESYLRNVFFDPIEMAQTGYVLPAWDRSRVAVGYRGERRWGRVIDLQARVEGFSWHLVGNGGIHSTATDMLRWMQALLERRALSAETTRLLFERHVDEGYGDSYYGYGWVSFDTDPDLRMIGHNGGNGFHFADLNFFPDHEDLLYVLLVNDASRSERFTEIIAQALRSSLRSSR